MPRCYSDKQDVSDDVSGDRKKNIARFFSFSARGPQCFWASVTFLVLDVLLPPCEHSQLPLFMETYSYNVN